jgi:hypothetical protein
VTDDDWDRLAAAGGRLLGEHCDHGHYAQHGIYRLDYPSGGQSYLCPPHWTDAWRAAGGPPQPLLQPTTEPERHCT